MKQLNLKQGDAGWHAHRLTARNASDAAAMLGCHPQKTRLELLHEKKVGLPREHSQFVQDRVFASGHAIEAKLRPVAEAIIGEEIYAVVGTEVVDGIELSASFDGLPLVKKENWECKSLNDELRAALPMPGPDGNDAANLPKYHRVQMQQQCMVDKLDRTLFTASDGEGDDRHCWYYPEAELGAEIIAGWKQFDIDLEAYVPVEVLDKPITIARRPDQLPALKSSVTGELVLESNIKEWEEAALAYIGSVRDHELITDEDFDNADAAAKWCVTSKTTLQGVQASLMSATGDVNVAVDTLDRIMDELDKTRLAFTKKIDARKAARKVEMLAEHQTLLGDFLRGLNKRLGRDFMPQIPVDFAGAIHGKRNFDSMGAALNAALANAKIHANGIADKIQINLNLLADKGAGYDFLFNDLSTIVLKANDDFATLVDKRISDHKAEEQRKADAQRETVRKEEEAKAAEASRAALVKIQGIQNQLQAAQGAKPAAIRQLLADTEAIVVDEATFGVHSDLAIDAKRQTMEALFAMVYHPNGAPKYSTTTFKDNGEPIMLNEDGTRSVFCDLADDMDEEPSAPAAAPAPAPAPAPAVASPMEKVQEIVRAATPPVAAAAPAPAPRPQAKPDTPPSLSLGQIGTRLGFALTAQFLSSLGFDGAKVKGAVLFHENQFPQICDALIKHVAEAKARELQTA